VEEVPIVPGDADRREMQQLLAQYDAPAYVRRARRVESALEELVGRCRAQRAQWLEMARTRLGLLRALAGGWDAVRPHLWDDEQVGVLEALEEALAPKLRAPVAPARSARAVRRALRELVASLERFNRRWAEYLPGVDLGPVNRLREGYNRYYLLEKECALRSPALARQGFRPLPPLTVADLEALLPPLPVPRLRG
jgi:hypothetical protein